MSAPGTGPLVVLPDVLEQARVFFEDRGVIGCEGTALIAGVPGEPADRLVVPDQRATPVPRASVTVTPRGDLDLLVALSDEQRYLARIHSHPGLAFHSPTEDANPVLTHEGAVSIVVPFFGLGLRTALAACAVHVLTAGRWTELPPGAERDAVVAVR